MKPNLFELETTIEINKLASLIDSDDSMDTYEISIINCNNIAELHNIYKLLEVVFYQYYIPKKVVEPKKDTEPIVEIKHFQTKQFTSALYADLDMDDFSDDEDDCDYILDNTDGYYTEGNGTMCACCEDNISDEDYIRYSEVEDEHLCDDCSVYLEDREDVCREHNSMYDSYREVYVYEDDVR